MRSQVKKGVSPILFLALIVISIAVVRFMGRTDDDSSMLMVDDNGPAITNDNDDDDGLRTVQDDVNTTTTTIYNTAVSPTYSPTNLPTYSPTMIPTTADNNVTNTPSSTMIVSQKIEQSGSIPSIRPTALSSSSSSRLPPSLSSQPNYSNKEESANPTSTPVKSPSPLPTTATPTMKTTMQPLSKSPETNRPTTTTTTRAPSSALPSLTPSKSPITTSSEEPSSSSSEPDADQVNQPDSTSTTYHAIKGCIRKNDKSSSITCIPPKHTSKLAVNCCSGSQSTNNLTCKRQGCFKTNTYLAAQNHCSQAGMRLCTSTELTSGICCDKGCGFNSKLSWASDVCAPTYSPTMTPTDVPTSSPTHVPTSSPTMNPTNVPTSSPTHVPTSSPTMNPTDVPTSSPTHVPTSSPTMNPTNVPTSSPTHVPTSSPTMNPTNVPTSNPTHVPTSSPTMNPTHVPTSSPTHATSSPTTRAGTLVTYNSGDRTVGDDDISTVGIIFEVQALRDLAITSLATFTESEDKIWSEVWIRQGRYQGFTSGHAGWRRIYFKWSQQHGNSAPLNIVFDDNERVLIPEGQIMSFYLVSPGKFLSDQGIVEGTVIAEDNSLKLYTGAAIDYGRWEEGCTDDQDCIFPARIFSGAISYETATMPPTSQPTPDPFEVQSSGLTLREEQWLDGHNVRRKKWHEMYGKKYKPLKWSEGLKDMAQSYADLLASNCGPTVHDSYENREGYGENLASNTGRDEGGGSWGELKPVELIMTRYVERESTWEPPANGHFTQVLWYATTHVGCADSVGVKPSGVVCRYQVCRYARAGNCGIRRFDDGSKEWWMKAVMKDSSSCLPFCPPEGC